MKEEIALAISMALKEETTGEHFAAIALALHQYSNDCVHDNESFVITIKQNPLSGWNSKIQNFRQLPK